VLRRPPNRDDDVLRRLRPDHCERDPSHEVAEIVGNRTDSGAVVAQVAIERPKINWSKGKPFCRHDRVNIPYYLHGAWPLSLSTQEPFTNVRAPGRIALDEINLDVFT